MKNLLKHYWPELLITLGLWVFVGWKLGLAALITTVILSILEITLSADNAVVNSRVLVHMSRKWQLIFLTVGIFIAVFVVRFILPIALVAVVTGGSGYEVLQLALNEPEKYGHMLHDIAPVINAFGGMFLFMVSLFFFLEKGREHLWVKSIEKPLQSVSETWWVRPLAILIAAGIPLLLVEQKERVEVAVAMAAGAGIYLLLHGVAVGMTKLNEKNAGKAKVGKQVGMAAFISFMYLEVLDASFSLDGVIGAFALTNNIVIIMIGLGIGAIWVRTFTLYMVRHHTLIKYRYLDAGAHYAIAALASIMFLKLLHIEVPELIVGGIGLVFIVAAIISSLKKPHEGKLDG